MSEYVGKICPYCRTEIGAGDAIVECSACNMPHHKECWVENQGCTTFGCLGTINTAESASTTSSGDDNADNNNQSSAIYCNSCGALNCPTSLFCGDCGAKIVTQGNPNPMEYANNTSYSKARDSSSNNSGQTSSYGNTYTKQDASNTYSQQLYSNSNYTQKVSGIAYDEYTNFIIQNNEYYIQKFHKMKSQNTNTTWNGSAFLLSAYWMIYRKMYGYAFVYFGAVFILGIIDNWFTYLITMALPLCTGIFGNYMYMRHIEKHIKESSLLSEPYRTQYIMKKGSVNTTAVILAVIALVILIALIVLDY